MRDLKTMYTEILAYCKEGESVNTEKFNEYLETLNSEERKALVTDVLQTIAKAVGSVFTKAAQIIGDNLLDPYAFNNGVYVINLTQLFESAHEDHQSPFVFEDGLKNALSQAFTKRQWPINAAPFSEVFIAVSEGRIRFNHGKGTELLILGGYDDVTNAEWKDPSLGFIIKEVMDTMGYSANAGYPGWLTLYSGQVGLSTELKQPEQNDE